MWAATKAVLWKAMLGIGCVAGTIAMLIVFFNLMDINGERVVYVPGKGHVPTGTRWCQEYPSQSPVPWMWLSYWVSCDDGIGLRKPRPEVSSPPSIAALADTAAAITAYDTDCARAPWRAKEHAAAAFAGIKSMAGEEKATSELELAVGRVLEQQKSSGKEAFCAAIVEKYPIVTGAEQ